MTRHWTENTDVFEGWKKELLWQISRVRAARVMHAEYWVFHDCVSAFIWSAILSEFITMKEAQSVMQLVKEVEHIRYSDEDTGYFLNEIFRLPNNESEEQEEQK